jgi:hypothetical protein
MITNVPMEQESGPNSLQNAFGVRRPLDLPSPPATIRKNVCPNKRTYSGKAAVRAPHGRSGNRDQGR